MRKNQERRSDHRDEKETRRVQDGVNQIKKHHRGPGCDASYKTGRGGDLGRSLVMKAKAVPQVEDKVGRRKGVGGTFSTVFLGWGRVEAETRAEAD